MDSSKTNTENIEDAFSHQENVMPTKSMGPIMRSREDDLDVWHCVRRFKIVSLIAMTAAFSASLDGYRKLLLLETYELLIILICLQKLILMAVLSPTRVLFDRWLPQAHPSLQANTSPHGVVSNPPVKLSVKLYVFPIFRANLASV